MKIVWKQPGVMRRILSVIWADRSGNVMLIAALASPMLVGVAALGIDTSYAYFTRNTLQIAADAGALAGAATDLSTTSTRLAVKDLVAKNVPTNFGLVINDKDIEPGIYDRSTKVFTPSAVSPNAVRVTTHRDNSTGNPLPTFFGKIFNIGSIQVNAQAVATQVIQPCFLVLNPTATKAFNITGNAGMTASNCGVAINSSNSLAAVADVAASAKYFCIVGGSTGLFSPAPKNCGGARDPLAYLPDPTPGSCQTIPAAGVSITFSPGTYCGNISFSSGKITFLPGDYYFQNSKLTLSGTSDLITTDASLFFDKDSSFSVSTSGAINIASPISGIYKGISIYQSRYTPLSTVNKLVGGGDYRIVGGIYSPTAALEMASISNSAQNSYVSEIIVNRLILYGDSNWTSVADPTRQSRMTAPAPALVF